MSRAGAEDNSSPAEREVHIKESPQLLQWKKEHLFNPNEVLSPIKVTGITAPQNPKQTLTLYDPTSRIRTF